MNVNNKEIFSLDRDYKTLLRKICSQVLTVNKNVPIQWEDIYWEFLYFFVQNKVYRPSMNVTFATFIGIECKNFARNKVRTFQTKKHSSTKYSSDFVERVASEHARDNHETVNLIRNAREIIDFTKLEEAIIDRHLINDEPLKKLLIDFNVSYSSLRRQKEKVKSKFVRFIDNY